MTITQGERRLRVAAIPEKHRFVHNGRSKVRNTGHQRSRNATRLWRPDSICFSSRTATCSNQSDEGNGQNEFTNRPHNALRL